MHEYSLSFFLTFFLSTLASYVCVCICLYVSLKVRSILLLGVLVCTWDMCGRYMYVYVRYSFIHIGERGVGGWNGWKEGWEEGTGRS